MLVVKETETPEIVDEAIEAVLAAFDAEVGEAERRFLELAGVNRDDQEVEAAYLASIDAVNRMWRAAALACFQAGQLYAVASANGQQAVTAKRISA